MHGRLAAGVSRRTGTVLAANLILVAVAAVLAGRASDRLAVAGGVGEGAEQLVVVVSAKPATAEPVVRQALTAIRSGIAADPLVGGVKNLPLRQASRGAALSVRFAGASAADRRDAVARIAEGIDAGPLEVALGGEVAAQAAAQERVEGELGRMALLAAPLIAVVLVLAFGFRHAVAPVLAGASGVLGSVAVLGLVGGLADLGAVGVAVSLAVGLAVAVECCHLLRRRFGEVPAAAPEEMLAEALRRAGPVIVIAAAGAGAAALSSLAVQLPAARSAALGGAVAALLAASSALTVMPAALVRWPRAARPGPAGVRGGRLRDAVAVRPWLGWLPALAVVAALVVAGAHAFDADVSVQGTGDLSGTEAARAADEIRSSVRGSSARALGAPETTAVAEREIEAGIPLVAALLGGLGMASGFLAGRSRRDVVIAAVGAVLPALAICGLMRLAAKGTLPLGVELAGEPHASALIAVLAAVGAVSVLRGALGQARTAEVGTVVAGAALGSLAISQIGGVAEVGLAVAAGLVLDLVAIRLVLVPALAHALPGEPASPRLPGILARLRR